MSLKFLSVVITIFSLLCFPVIGNSGQISSDEEKKLASTVKDFFTTWLVNRDAKAATKYISDAPIIGACAAPEGMGRSDQIPRKAIVDVFHQLFMSGLSAISPKSHLSDLIKAPGYISSKDQNVIIIDHLTKPYFEIFRLNVKAKGDDVRYVCKFDERISFRKAVSRPDVYYVVTKVKATKSGDDVELELLWVKERGSWRILTIAAPEY